MKYLILIALIITTASCSMRSIAHTPTRREINRAMKYSTWQYEMPRVKQDVAHY
jgi:hypothetical protein